ncbi:hypothetical protein [Zavarzinella formosa]|uniref:hypothetical protein n=1 Tax=Zavarzinella formosa TaxID=360055 RepID=UPI0002D8CCE3|nr:hypothetical protein [Zavarzinella formosa]
MKKLLIPVVAFALIGAVGCEKASSTAPSSNPNKPNETRKLTLVTKESQSVTQDKTDEVTVGVNRDNFKEPVMIDVKGLPSGVTLETKDLTIPADKSSLTLTLKAAPTATPVNDHPFQIVGKSKDIPEVVNTVKLTVKAK